MRKPIDKLEIVDISRLKRCHIYNGNTLSDVKVSFQDVKPHTTKVACFPLSANTRIASLGGGDYISTIQPELRILMTLRK